MQHASSRTSLKHWCEAAPAVALHASLSSASTSAQRTQRALQPTKAPLQGPRNDVHALLWYPLQVANRIQKAERRAALREDHLLRVLQVLRLLTRDTVLRRTFVQTGAIKVRCRAHNAHQHSLIQCARDGGQTLGCMLCYHLTRAGAL